MSTPPSYSVRFGGWYDGDNHKPFRGWYFVCRCRHVGLGQLIRQSAVRDAERHLRECAVAKERGVR